MHMCVWHKEAKLSVALYDFDLRQVSILFSFFLSHLYIIFSLINHQIHVLSLPAARHQEFIDLLLISTTQMAQALSQLLMNEAVYSETFNVSRQRYVGKVQLTNDTTEEASTIEEKEETHILLSSLSLSGHITDDTLSLKPIAEPAFVFDASALMSDLPDIDDFSLSDVEEEREDNAADE